MEHPVNTCSSSPHPLSAQAPTPTLTSPKFSSIQRCQTSHGRARVVRVPCCNPPTTPRPPCAVHRMPTTEMTTRLSVRAAGAASVRMPTPGCASTCNRTHPYSRAGSRTGLWLEPALRAPTTSESGSVTTAPPTTAPAMSGALHCHLRAANADALQPDVGFQQVRPRDADRFYALQTVHAEHADDRPTHRVHRVACVHRLGCKQAEHTARSVRSISACVHDAHDCALPGPTLRRQVLLGGDLPALDGSVQASFRVPRDGPLRFFSAHDNTRRRRRHQARRSRPALPALPARATTPAPRYLLALLDCRLSFASLPLEHVPAAGLSTAWCSLCIPSHSPVPRAT